jgi:biopolymer transport protein ExbB
MEDASWHSLIIEKGGVVMLLLSALSVYTLAVILLKLVRFWRNGLLFGDMDSSSVLLLSDSDEAVAAMNERHPVRRIAEYVMEAGADASERIAAYGNGVFRREEEHIRTLDMISGAAPLLGLLGTVVGMVKAFSGISEYGAKVDPAVLAGGIWEALLTTIAGLAVAIPAMIFAHIFSAKLDAAKQLASDAVPILAKRGHET